MLWRGCEIWKWSQTVRKWLQTIENIWLDLTWNTSCLCLLTDEQFDCKWMSCYWRRRNFWIISPVYWHYKNHNKLKKQSIIHRWCAPMNLRPPPPKQGGERVSMNNTPLWPHGEEAGTRWPAHLHISPVCLHPLLPLCQTCSRVHFLQYAVHFPGVPHIAPHSLFLSLEAENGRPAEWISSGMTTARWHLSLFCFLLFFFHPALFFIHHFSSLFGCASA